MDIKKFKFSTEVTVTDIYNVISKNYIFSITDYFELQREWHNKAYLAFKDLDKYFILISLVSKTFDSYGEYLIKYNYDEFYSVNEYELKKFNIVDIASELSMSKETARRKLLELQQTGLIIKTKKAVSMKRSAYTLQKPSNLIITMSRFMSNLSKLLKKSGIVQNEIKSEVFNELIKTNFTQCWNFFLKFQIQLCSDFKKKWFKDYESLSIWLMIVYNQNLSLRKKFKNNAIFKENIRDNYLDLLFDLQDTTGLNAMTISELTGIPRPTVIRKLTILVNGNFITKDKKGLYQIAKSKEVQEIDKHRLKNISKISEMACKFFNSARLIQN